ncbi:UNVERIFIED_CONTAM: Alpha-1,3/1,6-mannosyltransferase ALG2, partial [Eudyptes robustus]
VTFLHPDFGVGGAERLILDAAIAFDNNGHQVEIVTNQFSEVHCFTEALKFKDNIVVAAKWIPRTIFGKFYALLAYIRLCIASLYVIWDKTADVVFLDQISLPLVFFRLARPFFHPKLIFYCHFPDQKLTTRESELKKFYRYFIDGLENKTLGLADKIYVNSLFTKNVCSETFPTIDSSRFDILHPSLNTSVLDETEDVQLDIPDDFEFVFVSLNRYEGKKDHILALRVFNSFKDLVDQKTFAKCLLVFAGGYDPLNSENKTIYNELVQETERFGLSDNVKFYKSPSDAVKVSLLRRAQLLFYTPKGEHFGIVPLESMWLRTPVLALRSGGPIETIDNQKTGYLIEPDADLKQFADVFLKAVRDPELKKRMGEAGRVRVQDNFSFEAFTQKLLETV